MDNLNNITFFLEEKEKDNDNNLDEIKQMMNEFTSLDYFITSDNELLYNEYTVKDLIKICNYYGLDNIRTSKCKKQDIIDSLVYFESLPENFDIVEKRNRMWAYMTELLNDPKMKKFIINFL